MSFDWKTEETDWDTPPTRPAGLPSLGDTPAADNNRTDLYEIAAGNSGGRRRRIFVFLIIALVLIATLAGVMYRQIERRLAEGQRRAEADVLASHNTVQDAARAGDTELFVGFLSGRDPQWSVSQAGLVSDDAFANRSGFGFISAGSTLSPTLPLVILAPDLNSAEVSSPQSYEVDLGMGMTETITLTHTSTYRRGPDRWLLAPPDSDFWGDTQRIIGRHALLSFPARDSAVIQRFSRDLESVLGDFCGEPAGLCPPLTINFSTNPAALSAHPPLASDLTLPTPTLLGMPVDEAGYRALSRRYATIVVDSLATQYTGGACCDGNPVYDSLRVALLSRLGLLTWQPTGDQRQILLRDPAPLETLAALWQTDGGNANGNDPAIISPFIEFLIRRNDEMPIVELQRLLVDNRGNTLWDWLSLATDNRYASPADFERDWLEYATRSSSAQSLDIAFPEQDLQLICRQPGAVRASLYRFDFQGSILERDHDVAILDAPMLVGLPERDGVIVFGRNRRADGLQPYIWRDHQFMQISFGDDAVPGFVPLPPQGNSNSLTFLLDSGSPTSPYAVLPGGRCSGEGQCHTDTIIGEPVVSPESTHALYVVGASNPLARNPYQALIYLGDNEGNNLRLVDHGWSPFWLDENRFGYITTIEGVIGQAVVIRSATTAGATPADLSTAMRRSNELLIAQRPSPMGGTTGITAGSPSEEMSSASILVTTSDLADTRLVAPGTSVVIDRVLLDNTRENLFIFTANPLQPDLPGLALRYNFENESAVMRFEIDGEPFDVQRSYGFSPDSRWLIVGSRLGAVDDDTETKWELYLHATDSAETVQFTLNTTDDWAADWLFDWTVDGRWLAITTGGYVRLIAPADDITYPLVFDNLNCTSAVWVNEITTDVR